MTEYVKKSDVLELLSLPKDLIAEYVCDLKGLWIDGDEAEQTEPQIDTDINVGRKDEPQTRTDEDGGVWEYRNGNWWQLGKTENCSEKPNDCEPKICDTCRYYNSNIPCGSTPSACKEADKFAEEFVDGLKKLKAKPYGEREGE